MYHHYHALKTQCAVEQPEIINKGNGQYEFSTTCDDTQPFTVYRDPYGHTRRGRVQKKHGTVIVQFFGKDVPKSPME